MKARTWTMIIAEHDHHGWRLDVFRNGRSRVYRMADVTPASGLRLSKLLNNMQPVVDWDGERVDSITYFPASDAGW